MEDHRGNGLSSASGCREELREDFQEQMKKEKELDRQNREMVKSEHGPTS